jgi:bifunctional non-homologous end joining protein LigD
MCAPACRKNGRSAYLIPFEPCISTRGSKVAAGPDLACEFKHDGYRLIVQRDGKRVRLFTRNGHDWTNRYSRIVGPAFRNWSKYFVVDGEAILLAGGGVGFRGLLSRRHEVQLYALDILALDGDDLRSLPLGMRKANLARLQPRRARWHLHCPIRARRDRSKLISEDV